MLWDAEPVVELTLRLEDLIGDANKEIVVFNDSSFSEMTLLSEVALLQRGEVDRHVTATGEDVTGYRYLRFENGINLYYQPGLTIAVVHAAQVD